jgi:rRNA-processing protein FCF1
LNRLQVYSQPILVIFVKIIKFSKKNQKSLLKRKFYLKLIKIFLIFKVDKIRKSTSTNAILNDLNLTNLIKTDKKSFQNKLIIILDTNVFLSNLISIKTQSLSKTEDDNLIFVVPWIVVQELDNCKNKKDYSSNINKKAQEAINFIMKILQSSNNNNDKFYFENATQSNSDSILIKCYSPDDRILKCGLELQSQNKTSQIILVTNDKNLINKSLINSLKSLNYQDFLTKLSSISFPVNKTNEELLENKIEIDENLTDQQTNSSYNKYFQKYLIKLLNITEEHIIQLFKHLIKHFYKIQSDLGNIWLDLKDNSACSSSSSQTLNYIVENILKNFKRFLTITTKRNEQLFENILKSIQENVKIYDNLNIFYSNNQVNSIEKLKLSIKISIEIIRLFELFNQNGFDDLMRFYLKYLDYFNINGLKLSNLYKLCSQKLNNSSLEEQTSQLIDNFSIFQPIWEKFYNLSEINDLTSVKNNEEMYYQLMISFSSINYFKQLYEICLTESNTNNNNNNLNGLTLSIYLLYKLFDLDKLDVNNDENEIKKYNYLKYNLKNIFHNLNNNNEVIMKNGLNQLNEFKIKFDLINQQLMYKIISIE